MNRVVLARSRPCAWFHECARPLTSTLPYYEPDNGGYVHAVRAAHMHFDRKTGAYTHTSYGFWCGGGGFTYPAPKQKQRRGGRGIGRICAEPSAGRVICATCAGRAIGSGQHAEMNHHINGKIVKFSPRHGFMRASAGGEK